MQQFCHAKYVHLALHVANCSPGGLFHFQEEAANHLSYFARASVRVREEENDKEKDKEKRKQERRRKGEAEERKEALKAS